MGRFPKRSGVDAKLSEGSLFDLLLPIYKHTSAAAGEGGREREMQGGGEEMASIPSYLLRGVFIRPTVFPHIHYLHTYRGYIMRA